MTLKCLVHATIPYVYISYFCYYWIFIIIWGRTLQSSGGEDEERKTFPPSSGTLGLQSIHEAVSIYPSAWHKVDMPTVAGK